MRISENFLPYKNKTLILVCDRKKTKIYLADERDFNLSEQFENERFGLEDTERYTTKISETHFSKGHDEALSEREAHAFYKKLAQLLFEKKQANDFEELIVVIPHDDKNMLVNDLHVEVKEMLKQVVAKQLTNLPNDQLIEKLDQERRPS